MTTTTPVIVSEGLRKSYGSLEVLKGVTGTLYQGDVVSVIGPSGCGKSTFLRCLNRLETINGGRLEVMGIDISSPKLNQSVLRNLRSRVSMVFQHFNLFPHLTVLQNLVLAPSKCYTTRKMRLKRPQFIIWKRWDWPKSRCLSRPIIGRTKTTGGDRSQSLHETRGDFI